MLNGVVNWYGMMVSSLVAVFLYTQFNSAVQNIL